MEKPLISIITITYNRANIIHRCIESIQKQTYDNYEHVIVDGNSTDDTENVVLAYNDPHIKYVKLTKRGPQVQMRAGADLCMGKYVTFLDDDDEYLPNKLEKQVTFFESLPKEYGLIYCWMTYYDNVSGKKISVHKNELKGDVHDICLTGPKVCGTPTLMIRRDVFEKVGGTYDDSIGIIGSDWELAARICQITKVNYIPESLVKVYVNHEYPRLSTDFYSEKAKRGIIFHEHFLKKFHENFIRHPEYAIYHYYMLSKYHIELKNNKIAIKYYFRYLRYVCVFNPGISKKDSIKTFFRLFKL